MGNELTSRNEAADGDEPGGCELAFAVARVVAEHTDLKPHQIEELHITGDSIWILYAVHTGPRPVDIRIRTRRIDTETGTTISDHYGRTR